MTFPDCTHCGGFMVPWDEQDAICIICARIAYALPPLPYLGPGNVVKTPTALPKTKTEIKTTPVAAMQQAMEMAMEVEA